METVCFLLIIIGLAYLYVFLLYRKGWGMHVKNIDKKKKYFVSIVVACRNEQDNISNLIQQIKNQDYNKNNYELILVDDHSNDETFKIFQEEEDRWDNLHIIQLQNGETGKKTAIRKAISIAKGDIILCTDADCTVNPSWVATVTSYFINKDIKMVSGPVIFEHKDGIFHKFQLLEFLSLIGSGAAAIQRNKGIICNGANLAYRKDTYLEMDSVYDNIVSGDDVFLMHQIKNKYPNGIVFAKQKNAIVETKSQEDITSLLNQRKRWASKSRFYKDSDIVSISILVFVINSSISILFLLSFLNIKWFILFSIFFLFKYLVDYIFLTPILKFFSKKNLVGWILPFEIFYCFYIVLIAILSFNSSFEWKGRFYTK
tara:strand:+ start:1099 stop:2214 length:1116 start_codon:yes stop_codon:yes gene_type:complete